MTSALTPAANSSSPNTLPATVSAGPPPAAAPALETGMAGPRRIGLFIAFLVFGVFGLWSALAPIDGAAFAPGKITVRSYKKTVQHLEGGIVKEIRVQNGDHVDAGQILLVLDSTRANSDLEIYSSQLLALLALEARLIAERDDLESVVYPSSLNNADGLVEDEIVAQNQVFRTRKASREGAIAVLTQRIGQLEQRSQGLRSLRQSKQMLASSYEDELQDLRALLAEGFADKLRLREIERSHATMVGEAGELDASIASTEIQIGETKLEILQGWNEFQTEVAGQLAETQTKLKDVSERVTALRDVLSRTEVRAPVTGTVNGLAVHTEGGVIRSGDPLAEIVPQSDELVIEASVSPLDIDRVAAGQTARVRMSSFNSKNVPQLFGTVLNVSADAHFDEQNNSSYYLARIAITPESLADLEGLELVPGMPAEVFITTGSRTFLQYLLKPLSNSIARSFIED